MKRSGRILASALELSKKISLPGKTTIEIDFEIHSLILKHGGVPSFLDVDDYEFSSCIAVNEQVVHAVPNDTVLRKGDMVTVDIGVSYKGHCTDAARTFVVGKKPSKRQARLIDTASIALEEGIAKAVSGGYVGDISYAIQRRVELNGFRSPLELGGHGIGFHPHEEPFIPNTGVRGRGELLKKGACLAIEPIIMEDSIELVVIGSHTYYSKDKKLSSHMEDTIIVYDLSPVILTRETLNGGIV